MARGDPDAIAVHFEARWEGGLLSGTATDRGGHLNPNSELVLVMSQLLPLPEVWSLRLRSPKTKGGAGTLQMALGYGDTCGTAQCLQKARL